MENFKPNFHTLNFPAFSPVKIGELLVKNPHFNPRTCYEYRITNAWIAATFLLMYILCKMAIGNNYIYNEFSKDIIKKNPL